MKRILTIYFLYISFYLPAQVVDLKREIKYTAEVGTYLSTNGETPFWLKANQYGTVPSTSPIVTLRGSISSDYKKAITKEDQYKLSKFDWGYGLNIVGNVGKENQFLIPEAYIKAKYGAFEIYAGRRKEIFGLVDSTLSSGSYIWSGNAMPMPKIQISTPNFVPLGFTKGFLSFKGNYAHGWFENSRTDVENFYLHQKSLYFRLGNPDWKFHFYGGFNHQAQWGGELLYPDPKNLSGIGGKVGSSFNDYVNVILGRSLAAEGDTSKVGVSEATNRSGNHLGTLDFGFDVNIYSFSILCYRQSIFEDGSLAYLNNITDGLWGLSVVNKTPAISSIHINKVNFEYLNTLSQGGLVGGESQMSRLRGLDNYFNSGIYRNGWTYLNQTLGTPFINKINNGDSNLTNNVVEMYHLGLLSSWWQIPINTHLSYSSNYGKLGVKTPIISVLSVFIQAQFRMKKNIQVQTTLSFDNNSLKGINAGLGVTLKKNY
jgi:Capsule assembly protein Wzi